MISSSLHSHSLSKSLSVLNVETNGLVEPLYQVKLLSALRSGDPALIQPFLIEIGKDRRKSQEGDNIDTGAAALHLAVRCASVETVTLLLSHRAISPNGVHPQGSGTTPLHLAASLGRTDIVNLLLEQEGVDDTLRDANGKTCKDVTKSKECIRAIDDSRSFLNASYRSLLRSYVLSPLDSSPNPALLSLLSSPRIRFVNLSYLDDDSGSSLLHQAAKRKDLRLIELAVRAGADVFVRDRRGRMAHEGVGKDDKVRVFLRQFANHDTTLIDGGEPLSEPPTLKGYLNKYTNVARGYNTRWFVLKDGVLSYYRHQEDETIASRGSISMKTAVLKVSPGGDKLRFEVHSTPSSSHASTLSLSRSPSSRRGSRHGHSHHDSIYSGSASVQKWYVKANHPVEASRWTRAIGRSIEWWKQEAGTGGGGDGDDERERSGDSEVGAGGRSVGSVRSESRRSGGSGGSGSSKRPGVHRGSSLPTPAGSALPQFKGQDASGGGDSASSFQDHDGEEEDCSGISPNDSSRANLLYSSHNNSDDAAIGTAVKNDDSSGTESTTGGPLPYENTFELHGNSTTAQMELTSQLLSNLSSVLLPPTTTAGAGSSTSIVAAPSPSPRTQELKTAVRESFDVVTGLMNEYMQMTREREEWWRSKLDRERERQKVWEESLQTVVKEGEVLERELRNRSRRRGSKFFDSSAGDGLRTVRAAKPPSFSTTYSSAAAATVTEEAESSSYFPPEPEPSVPGVPAASPAKETVVDPTTPVGIAPSPKRPPQRKLPPLPITVPTARDGEVDTEDDEDEFFDAIESNNLPNLVVHESLTTLGHSKPLIPPDLNTAPFVAYRNLRTKLSITSDDRPSTSLWSVLKHSIGKDLTKISFPVFFNEPTSMLQRMAEDMEFSECLDVAAREEDQYRRIAFVAAFAMSNYSSTIGRIAKPFNPMLSETFEYLRFDKEYRYVSEQVSHHPPISACWAESPLWHYFGEVDAQNKFMGKSFEIRPTGVAHAELLIPEDLGPGYPKATGKFGKGKVTEHYSWKKVTTNVSGFILGSPTIDHYGEMTIKNHRTGDRCVLTFKPRGWRGRDAYEISGSVMDSSGNVVYEIAGRWNGQLIARRVGTGTGFLHPDVSVSDPSSPSSRTEYILLWRNSEKPPAPFNLTPFAITLNDCPKDTLKPYLCPTDCRLRPDQRAFELGKYELANTLKNQQEEFQRATRKAREEGRLPRHKPRWFRAETDGDTGERVWAPVKIGGDLEYWIERERVWTEIEQSDDREANWKAVDSIFIKEPVIIQSS